MPFRERFEPIVLIGENLHLMPDDKYYRVVFLEGLPLIEHDFGATSSGDELRNQEITEIYLGDNELGQYRMMVVDNLKVYVKQPSGIGKWLTRNGQAYLIDYSTYSQAFSESLQLTEFYQWEDTPFIVDVTATADNTTASRLWFFGYRYVLEELKEVPQVATTVWTQGYRPPVRK